MDRKLHVMALAGILFLLIHTASAYAQNQARADIKNAEGKSVGTASLRETKDGVLMTVNVKGLPQGLHAVHFHSVGKCEGPAFTSAGPHFNPMHEHHGGTHTAERHVGDFGNIEADASGKAHLDWKGKLSLSGKDSIIGRSVVVHEKEDDLKTDPAGNSGARFACGTINAAD